MIPSIIRVTVPSEEYLQFMVRKAQEQNNEYVGLLKVLTEVFDRGYQAGWDGYGRGVREISIQGSREESV